MMLLIVIILSFQNLLGIANGANCSLFTSPYNLTDESGTINTVGKHNKDDICRWNFKEPSFEDAILFVNLTYLFTLSSSTCTTAYKSRMQMPDGTNKCGHNLASECFLYSKNSIPASCQKNVNTFPECSRHASLSSGIWPQTGPFVIYFYGEIINEKLGFILNYTWIDCTETTTITSSTTKSTTTTQITTPSTTASTTTTKASTTTATTTSGTTTKASTTLATTPSTTTSATTATTSTTKTASSTSKSTASPETTTTTTKITAPNITTKSGGQTTSSTTRAGTIPTTSGKPNSQSQIVIPVAAGAGGFVFVAVIVIIIVLVIRQSRKRKQSSGASNDVIYSNAADNNYTSVEETRKPGTVEETSVELHAVAEAGYDTLHANSATASGPATYDVVVTNREVAAETTYDVTSHQKEQNSKPIENYEKLSKPVDHTTVDSSYDALDRSNGPMDSNEYATVVKNPTVKKKSRKAMRSIRVIDPVTQQEAEYADMSGPHEDEEEVFSEYDSDEFDDDDEVEDEPALYSVINRDI